MYCRYCNEMAQWVDNDVVYGKKTGKSHKIWYCKKCNAYVGCHNNTMLPLGTMANAELREARRKAHYFIDQYWKSRSLTRGEVYKKLKEYFGTPIHMAESDLDVCQIIIKNHKKIIEKI